ncbi:FliM/FliN family flagellar motor C-terminal domain-containing protein [Aestuariibius sp. 2305UL40-4]|uniref:flagellar motor switch protein FliM n=1 Tax=Aestuariibius violaceus TaxID=3234132 RepID=UPI00345EB1EA
MGETDQTTSVLRRKARGSGRPVAEALSDVGIGRATRKAAEAALGAPLHVLDFERETCGLEGGLSRCGDDPLLFGLDGPTGRRGLIALDAQARAAVVELSTLGRVLAEAPVGRRPTAAEAALVVPFVEALMAALGEAALGELAAFGGAEMLPDPGTAELLLAPENHEVTRIRLRLNDAGREGQVLIMLPAPVDKVMEDKALPSKVEGWEAKLRQGVLAATSDLEIVLARMNLPFSAIRTFAPGATIPLPSDAFGKVTLESLDGRVVARGRLGQVSGVRAVRLAEEAGQEGVFSPSGAVAREAESVEARRVGEAPSDAAGDGSVMPSAPARELLEDDLKTGT